MDFVPGEKYQTKINKILDRSKLSRIKTTYDKIILKLENDINGTLPETNKRSNYGKYFPKTTNDRLTNNIPVSKAIEVALHLCSSNTPHNVERPTTTLLLKLTVKKFNFIGNVNWYCQINGFTIGTALSVTLANIWIKTVGEKLSADDEMSLVGTRNFKQKCPLCYQK